VNPLVSEKVTVWLGFDIGPGKTTLTVRVFVAVPAGMLIALVTSVWLTWVLLVPAKLPTLTLFTGALAGGILKEESSVMVRVKLVPGDTLFGETLKIPLSIPEPPLLNVVVPALS